MISSFNLAVVRWRKLLHGVGSCSMSIPWRRWTKHNVKKRKIYLNKIRLWEIEPINMNSVLTVSLIGTLLMRQSQGLLLEILLVLTVGLMYYCTMYIYQTPHLKKENISILQQKGAQITNCCKNTLSIKWRRFPIF